MKSDNCPQGGLPAKKQKSCPYRSKYWGSFSMCILLTVLKHERQQCHYKHTENHKILECKIYHRHHLHSIKEMEGNATLQVICTKSIGAITWSALANQLYPSDLLLEYARNTVVKIILSYKHIFSHTL
jgi:hypothetical protein